MEDPSSKKVATSPAKLVREYFFLRVILFSGFASCLETLVTYPAEYVKTQLQLDEKGNKKLYRGIVDCVKKTVQQHSVTGLYRGLPVLLYGFLPRTAIRFGSFELYKEQWLRMRGYYSLNPAQSVLCGFAAGVTEALLIVTPVETMKVQFIDDQRSGKLKYKGFVHGLGVIFKEHGISGMYKGVVATVAKQGTGQATRFWMMNTCKNWYRRDDPHRPIPNYVIGAFGGLAGFVSVLVNNPVDVVKTRMQAIDGVKYKSILDCFVRMMINEGPLSFYKGTVPRSSRAVLDVGVTFMIYDNVMQKLDKFHPKQL